MADGKTLLATERRTHRIMLLAILGGVVALGFDQHNQRALFLWPGSLPNPAAFTAIAPTGGAPGLGGGGFASPAARAARLALAPPTPLGFGATPSRSPAGGVGSGGTPAIAAPAAAVANAGEVPSLADGGSVADGTTGPQAGTSAPGFLSPAIAGAAAAADPGSVGAVPEPASWLIMILGVGAIGTMLRRRARGATVEAALAAA